MTRFLFATLIATSIAIPAIASDVQTGGSKIGTILTDENGMTLYVFDQDKGDASNCYDECAGNWPPLLADEDAVPEGDYGLITRRDGSQQWTYEGKPLYLWPQDSTPGDVTGDGINGVWHVAKPD
jgi:predicted lipoprotein with Yx(FWY)xxD motif